MSPRVFLRYISQNIAGMICLSCYILVDTWFVSLALGTRGLAALNLAITIFSVVAGAGQLLGVGGGTDFALRRAEGRDHRKSLPTALGVGGLLALIFVLIGLLASGPLTRLLGADESTFSLTETYVRMTLLFAPAYIFNAILQGFVRNDGSPHLAMLSMLVSSLANIILDYLFLFPLGLGMFGAVLATGLSACLTAPVLLAHFLQKRCSLLPFAGLHSLRDMLRQLSCGVSALIGELASAVSLLTFNLLLMRISGPVVVAAYGVIANAALVATAIFTGLGQGIQPLASQLFGSDNHAAMRTLLGYIRNTVALLSIALFACVFFLSAPIACAFNHEQNMQLQTMAQDGLKIYFAGYLFAGGEYLCLCISQRCKPSCSCVYDIAAAQLRAAHSHGHRAEPVIKCQRCMARFHHDRSGVLHTFALMDPGCSLPACSLNQSAPISLIACWHIKWAIRLWIAHFLICDQTTPCASIASATFRKPAIFAPAT